MKRTSSWLMRRSARDMARAPFSVKVLSFMFKILHNRTQILVSRGTQASLSDPDPDWGPDSESESGSKRAKWSFGHQNPESGLDPARIGFQLKMLDPDPDKTNKDPLLTGTAQNLHQQGSPLRSPRHLPGTKILEPAKIIYIKCVKSKTDADLSSISSYTFLINPL